jgi:putative selenium metabolism hydrolase
MPDTELRAAAERGRDAMIDFAQRLIRTPSLSGDERAVADLVLAEMTALGYDEVWRDETGNVIGHIRPTTPDGLRHRIMFNTHLDHVDVGDPAAWPYPPYAATIADGALWGRGASDLKGPLACQVHALAALKTLGRPIPNDLYVTAVVQEEVGGLGARHLAPALPCDYCILGEPTTNRLMHGHRGRVELEVVFRGRSVHASVPATGVNPLYPLARFLQGLEALPMVDDPANPGLGPSSVAPTLLSTDQTSRNVIPAEVTLILDWRNVPVETPEAIVQKLQSLLDRSLIPGAQGQVSPTPPQQTSYTGVTEPPAARSPTFGTPADHPLDSGAQRILTAALGRDIPVGLWPFATDGGHFVGAGATCIGFSPAWEEVIHTVDERISLALMVEAFAGYAALALEL